MLFDPFAVQQTGITFKRNASDLDHQKMQVMVAQSKGCKDRYTKLTGKILPVLDQYIEEFKPIDLIFYGEKGKAFSERSMQEVVKSIACKAGVAQKVTPKTLQHSFATQGHENRIDLRYI